MKQWLQLTFAELVNERLAGAEEDVHFPQSLAAAVIAAYSEPGQRVLDPFAGYGTTLVVAERMGRKAVGVELLPERVDLIRARLAGDAEVVSADVEMVGGDAREVGALVTGPIDLCLTSPPYMTAVDHPQNPLTAYQTLDGDYATYLAELGEVFGHVAALLRPGGHVVVNVANVRSGNTITPLAWDVARVVGEHLMLRQEVFLCWDRQPEWVSGDYCLVFQLPPDPGKSRM